MNITMSSTHIKTLCKLKELCDKHNCSISYGLNNNSENDYIEWDLIKNETEATDSIIEELQEKLDIDSSDYKCFTYWFQLYDSRNKKYHSLSYIQEASSFIYSKDYFELWSDETEEWMYENFEYDNFYSCAKASQSIRGFDNIDTSFVNVYREGMLLKFFGDLVCDYLGEERIHEVY